MRPQLVPLLLVLLGCAGVVAAVALLAGYPWAIGVAGVLALIAGVLLYDPSQSYGYNRPDRARSEAIERGKRR